MNPLKFIRSIPSSVKSGWVRAFDFRGTSTRSEFVGFYVGNHLILYFLIQTALAFAVVGAKSIGFEMEGLGTTLFTAWMFGSAIALISCVIRRYRDTQKSPWYLAIPAAAIAVAIAVGAITKAEVLVGIGLTIFLVSLVLLALFLSFWPSNKPSAHQISL